MNEFYLGAPRQFALTSSWCLRNKADKGMFTFLIHVTVGVCIKWSFEGQWSDQKDLGNLVFTPYSVFCAVLCCFAVQAALVVNYSFPLNVPGQA